jgi:lipid-A-disaccharide synthase-like uncharacterized protein
MTRELVVAERNKVMFSARTLAGAILALTLARAALAAAETQQPAASAADGATDARTTGQLQAENQALKARISRLDPAGIWYVVGFIGQFIFMMRFVVQWIASERKKQSVVPLAFWYLSLVGSLITIVYAAYRRDPVFTAAFCLNILIYMRNLYFIHGKPKAPEAPAPA